MNLPYNELREDALDALTARVAELEAALQEVITQQCYVGFGDPAHRNAYTAKVARAALAKEQA